MTFEGFEKPNYTQTPNFFFDEILLQKGITIAEVKIVGFMIRMTYGWQRQGNVLQFTYDEIQNAVQLGREAVSNGLKRSLENGYIQRKETADGKYRYRLHIKDFEEYPWDLEFQWKKVFKFENKQTEKPQFENRTSVVSSEIELESVRKSNQGQFGNRTEKIEKTQDFQGLEPSLNKSLNKYINKNKEEEEETLSQLIDLTNFFSKNITDQGKPYVKAQFVKWLNLLPYEVIKKQLEICVDESAMTWKYVDTSLKRLQESNITTVEQLEQKIADHKAKTSVKHDKPVKNQNRQTRKEILPDWFNEDQTEKTPINEPVNEVDQARQEIEDMLAMFRNGSVKENEFTSI